MKKLFLLSICMALAFVVGCGAFSDSPPGDGPPPPPDDSGDTNNDQPPPKPGNNPTSIVDEEVCSPEYPEGDCPGENEICVEGECVYVPPSTDFDPGDDVPDPNEDLPDPEEGEGEPPPTIDFDKIDPNLIQELTPDQLQIIMTYFQLKDPEDDDDEEDDDEDE